MLIILYLIGILIIFVIKNVTGLILLDMYSSFINNNGSENRLKCVLENPFLYPNKSRKSLV